MGALLPAYGRFDLLVCISDVAGSLAVVAILDRWTGTPHSLVAVSVIFAVLQAVVAIIGYDSLKHCPESHCPSRS